MKLLVVTCLIFLFSCKQSNVNPPTNQWTVTLSGSVARTYTSINTNLSGSELTAHDANGDNIDIIFSELPQPNNSYTVSPTSLTTPYCSINVAGQAVGGGTYTLYANQGSV